MNSKPCYVVNAFCDSSNPAATGNPAAIVLTTEELSESYMQTIAAQFNLSETAFVHGSRIRYFTPKVEVGLCGHATLAASSVLLNESRAVGEFETIYGTKLSARKAPDDGVTMTFPNEPVESMLTEKVLPMLGAAFGLVQQDVIATSFSEGLQDLLVEITSETFENLSIKNLAALHDCDYGRGVILCCVAPDDKDFWSRFFAPKAGIDEDPVTGSAHCALAPYFAKKLGKNVLVGHQQSPRGGIVTCRVQERQVHLTGQASTIVEGKLLK